MAQTYTATLLTEDCRGATYLINARFDDGVFENPNVSLELSIKAGLPLKYSNSSFSFADCRRMLESGLAQISNETDYSDKANEEIDTLMARTLSQILSSYNNEGLFPAQVSVHPTL